jgi:hypothetical protein
MHIQRLDGILTALDLERAMTLHLTPETEARLTKEARRQGVSVEALIERLISERASADHGAAPALPVWHLGGGGPYHRRDIYNDVR